MATPARLFLLVLIAYLAASCFSVTIKRFQPQPQDFATRYRPHAFVVLSTPRVLRGEEPHFLMMAHSLAADGDLYLSREYTRTLYHGGPERGVYWTGRPAEYFLQHFARKPNFGLVGTHPIGLSTLLAGLLWPLAGTPWMEAGAIWVTALFGALGVLIFLRLLQIFGYPWPAVRNASLCLAFATPWFSYSRTLYTEIYLGVAFLLILLAITRGRWWWAMPVCVAAAWIKYPALLLFAAVGTAALWAGYARPRPAINIARYTPRHPWRIFAGYAVAGALTLVAIFFYNRAMYADASWVTAAPGATTPRALVRAGAPIAWVPGDVLNNIERLFTDFDKGIFPHCPLLLLAIGGLILMARRPGLRHRLGLLVICALPFTVLHICYSYLMTGDSYTTRYLVPMVPLVMVGLPVFWQWSRHKPVWRRIAVVVLLVSLLNNVIAGVFPGLSFNNSPWEIWHRATLVIAALAGKQTF